MAQHTPGPWVIHETGMQILGGRQCLTSICNVFANSRGADPEEHRANASLIVAAPDLLADLRQLVHLAETLNGRQHAGLETTPAMWSLLHDVTNQVKATIAKAEGRS